MYINRTIETFIKKVSKQFPVLLITGPRQVGKTTLLKFLGEKREYVSLDDPTARDLANTDPSLFLQRFTSPLVIDEIQYAPELLTHIKIQVDKENKPGMYWLTGSQQFHLMKGVSETLAGRIGIINLLGFSSNEENKYPETRGLIDITSLNKKTTNHKSISLKLLYKKIWRGTFPKIVAHKNIDRDLFYSSYVQTYLQRDVRDLTNVGNETSFLRFLRSAAARTGHLINMSDMARDADISPVTAKQWTSILQTSGIIFLLEPYHSNVTKRMVKAPKLYFLDTGLCAYLTGWNTPETLETGAMTGSILETWVMTEIIKSYWHRGKPAPIYYYRDKDKKEIDLLVIQDGRIFPFEIKKTSSPKKNMIKHFKVLEKLNLPIGPGGLICLYPEILPLPENNSVIPIAYI